MIRAAAAGLISSSRRGGVFQEPRLCILRAARRLSTQEERLAPLTPDQVGRGEGENLAEEDGKWAGLG